MFVTPPFTPPGQKAGVRMFIKISSTVMALQETEIETDTPQAAAVHPRLHLPKLTPAKPNNFTMLEMADEAGVREWSNRMLSGHPGGRATKWEQWGKSFALKFKGVVDTMSHSLRIKEDSYYNMFKDKEKAVLEAKVILERAQKMKDEAKVIKTKETEYVETIHKLEIYVNFLREKVDVSSQKIS